MASPDATQGYLPKGKSTTKRRRKNTVDRNLQPGNPTKQFNDGSGAASLAGIKPNKANSRNGRNGSLDRGFALGPGLVRARADDQRKAPVSKETTAKIRKKLRRDSSK